MNIRKIFEEIIPSDPNHKKETEEGKVVSDSKPKGKKNKRADAISKGIMYKIKEK